MDYVPTEEGDYDIAIKFSDEHVPGSPFKVTNAKSVQTCNSILLTFHNQGKVEKCAFTTNAQSSFESVVVGLLSWDLGA